MQAGLADRIGSSAVPLAGRALVPGDKSISHRALMLGALALGRTRIDNLSQGEDVAATAAALAQMGVAIARGPGGATFVAGLGTGGLAQPRAALDMGNSGTSARLLMGMVASHPIAATFTGDASLSRRPMARVIEPLSRLGAEFSAAPGGRLPLTLRGAHPALPTAWRLPIASAQVKSALLLAGLNIAGITRVIEPVASRDHSERMLALFGADIRCGGGEIALRGEADLSAQHVAVPGDPSAAAFLAVAALVVPGSDVTIENVGINPMRTGLYEVLRAMGGDIVFENERMASGEPVADIRVRASDLTGITVDPRLIPAMIDEFPILFVAAAFARGKTSAGGLAELRVKESDRIAAMAAGLAAIGARVSESPDGLTVTGSGGAPLAGGAAIDPALDHRIAMSFAVAGLMCRQPLRIADMACIATSFPGFAETLAGLKRP